MNLPTKPQWLPHVICGFYFYEMITDYLDIVLNDFKTMYFSLNLFMKWYKLNWMLYGSIYICANLEKCMSFICIFNVKLISNKWIETHYFFQPFPVLVPYKQFWDSVGYGNFSNFPSWLCNLLLRKAIICILMKIAMSWMRNSIIIQKRKYY